MSITANTCYMCDKPVVSKEHAPPKCLFPKGNEFRSDLITVPSCKEHNQDLSQADVILLQLLLSQPIQENRPFKILKDQFLNRDSVNFKRKIGSFSNQINQIVPATYINTTGEQINSGLIFFKQSASIIFNSLEKLGCALYFNDYQKKLTGKYYVNLDVLIQKNNNDEKQIQDLYVLNKNLFDMFEIKFKGPVPNVFQYRIYDHGGLGQQVIIEFLFYEEIRGFFKCTKS
ncbi:hypothetical protein [Acinetobacter sp. WCHAc060025]|uniref:hypothetical protein n=1 Tax=Acinetobacter sp. WCHAc060025 TaxID=2518625 RepID=UPI001022DA2A|nr:hypothetical protein [Acinetobacter sp. WCHAc060025]RZG76734.1 hypothetical protein EXE09_06805 [Acinetobacter sp. WCHAc060025]